MNFEARTQAQTVPPPSTPQLQRRAVPGNGFRSWHVDLPRTPGRKQQFSSSNCGIGVPNAPGRGGVDV